jgi:hypothetical protein
VTGLPAPTFFVANVPAAVPVSDTASLPILPKRAAVPVSVAVMVPSYSRLVAERPVIVRALGITALVGIATVTGVAPAVANVTSPAYVPAAVVAFSRT